MQNPSNEVLSNMIENLTEKLDNGFDRIENHFKVLNGNVGKNTEGRIKQSIHNKWTKILMLSVALPTIFLLIKQFLLK